MTDRAEPGVTPLTAEEAIGKALLFTFQLSGKDYRKMQAAMSEVAFIRALEQDGYTVRPLDAATPRPGLVEAARRIVERNVRRMDPDAEPVMGDDEELILYATAGDFRALVSGTDEDGPCHVCGSRHPRWTHWHAAALASGTEEPGLTCWSPDDHRPGCYCRQGGEVLER